jgi:hypothetical protein
MFKPSARVKFQQALFENPNPKYAILVVIDGAPVAVQASGKQLKQSDPGRELILFPIVEDSFDTTAILASILNDKPLESNVALEDFNSIAPTLGEATLLNLKLSLLAVFVVVNALLIYYFRKRSLLAVLLNILMVVWTIAGLKIFGTVLDLSLIVGVLTSFILFNTIVSYFLYQIRSASSGTLTDDEVVEVYERTKKQYWGVTFLTVVVAFIVSYWGSEFMVSLFIGFGFGVLFGLGVLLFPANQLIALIFLSSKKWKI